MPSRDERVDDKPRDKLETLRADKALAIAMYAEAVAAYRYIVLAEKARSRAEQDALAGLADEEQDHRQRLEQLVHRLFPDASFYLSPEDKDMVVVGQRLLAVYDEESFAEALQMILFSEKRVASFYRKLSKYIPRDELSRLFRELADEGSRHYERVRQLAQHEGGQPRANGS